MWLKKKNSIEDCCEQFSMLSIKKICKTHISHIDNSILAYLLDLQTDLEDILCETHEIYFILALTHEIVDFASVVG